MSIRNFALTSIKDYIASGVVAPGGRLPSERDLAETLGIGRNSLREALKVLEAVGLVESRVGDGTYITDQPALSIGRTIGMSLAVWGTAIVEILAARRIIESGAAGSAAENATSAELNAMQSSLTTMAACRESDDVRGYLSADMNFHRFVARATQNVIVTQIVEELIELLENALRQSSGDQLPATMEDDVSHQAIFEAIAAKDSARATSVMQEHLAFSSEYWRAIASIGTVQERNLGK